MEGGGEGRKRGVFLRGVEESCAEDGRDNYD